jgi:general secretion pathway protein N
VHDAATGQYALGRLEWTLSPFWLAVLHPRSVVHLSGSEIELTGRISASYRSIRLQDVSGKASVSLLTKLYSPAALFDPGGQFGITSEMVSFDDRGVQGRAELVWENASLNVSDVKPLGDYRLSLNGEGQVVHLVIATSQGSLSVTGQGKVMLDTKQYSVVGEMVPTAHATELEPVLRLVGGDAGGGRRTFAVNGGFQP